MKNTEKIMRELNQKSIISLDAETNGLWGQPFAVSALLYDVCLFFGDSTNQYCDDNNIELGERNTHNPIYDCESAYCAFKHFINN